MIIAFTPLLTTMAAMRTILLFKRGTIADKDVSGDRHMHVFVIVVAVCACVVGVRAGGGGGRERAWRTGASVVPPWWGVPRQVVVCLL